MKKLDGAEIAVLAQFPVAHGTRDLDAVRRRARLVIQLPGRHLGIGFMLRRCGRRAQRNGGHVVNRPAEQQRLGVGYQFTDTFRADLTAEYFEGRFNGSSSSTAPCAGQGAGTSCAFSTGADYSALGLMANAYVDFGTLAGFTPYVGAGLGATRLNWDTAVERATCVGGGGACAGAAGSTAYEGRDSWRFTYALMAGVSYDLSDQLKLDVGYRYSHIADGEMFGFGAEALAGARGDKGFDDGLSRHEIRAGPRFSF